MKNSLAYQYGYGLFETIKVEDSKLIFLDDHIKRLVSSTPKINMPLEPLKNLRNRALLYMKENNIKNGILKIMYIKDTNYRVEFLYRENPYNKCMYERGFKINFSHSKRNPYSNMVYLKTNNYLENILEKNNSKSLGFHEPLFLNVHDHISEGATSNIFFVKNNILYTPSINCGILNGIMRKNLIKFCRENNIKLIEGQFSKEFLLDCDEVFITNSILEIMPVSIIENKQFNMDAYKLTKEIYSKFYDYMRKEGK
ncbi:MAG: aminotransferase class IV [Anaeromicrobium sp.]|jgi:4-amino-4-deoxychorismate lyase|uniref:aminotransferase class IV n=1 Tax=Anaeromicrobium sp. TaxID=1929132 RepID=UPI0025CCBFD7|nr:aminotransferase class IV [Anaeromicrobium sp.]MCT4593782.1 aminotransferase class IV [Anaeromicrobium sp.]